MDELRFVLRLARPDGAFAFDGAIPLEGVTAIVGPSGSGKTTFLMILAGLAPGAQGEAVFADRIWMQGRHRMRPEDRRVGMVFQDGRLFDHLTVAQNLAYGARRRGIDPGAVQGVIDGMGLRELLHRRPQTLSGGEARRVAVGRALASGPDILFMDEPLSGLDDEAKAQLLPYLARAVAGSGVPVVYVTHSRAEVTQFADRILRMEEGRIAGWDVPPAALDVQVVAAGRGAVTLALGGAEFALPGQGHPGDARRIVLAPGGTLLSRDRVGPSDALASLPVEVVEVVRRPAGTTLVLRVEGQDLIWRVGAESGLGAAPPDRGAWLWLTILDAHLR